MEKAFTFDDISLLPLYSDLLPSETDISIRLCDKLTLTMPILSAAMDTVTESKMAQVMAQRGGFGVIHKNMSIESQARQVDKVKKYESGMILDPINLAPEDLLEKAHQIMKAYSISGVPITVNKKLVGIITNRDLRFETDLNQKISQFMTPKDKLVTADKNISLEEAKKILHRHRIEKLPVVDEEFKLIGLITIKDIEKAKAFPFANKDPHGRLFVGAAVGTSVETRERVHSLVKAGVDLICVDTAHGHSKKAIDILSYIKKEYPDCLVMAGECRNGGRGLGFNFCRSGYYKSGYRPGQYLHHSCYLRSGSPSNHSSYGMRSGR